ncbi:MAG: pirin family protein [Pseudomonadota bacterium]
MALLHESMLRGRTETGWLDSLHTFSFGSFRDPQRMGHRSLRVINEDRVIPGAGFGKHRHQDMEILTLVIAGALRHKDSLGNGSVIRPGEIQRMSAGRGISHSEMNASASEPVHFLQIWIRPAETGVAPSYEQKTINQGAAEGRFHRLASPEGGLDAVRLLQDAALYQAILSDGRQATHHFVSGRAGFIQVMAGQIEIGGERLGSGDGLQFDDEAQCTVTATADAQVLLFDLA